ncbi:MAG: DUF951 domain-containing protein [Clostridiales bacterium]|nr:DUF951 domain-containing protein [Clostridiales bacterium]
MEIKVGLKITAKKPHACGGSEWVVVRTGADVKLKCLSCGRFLFLSHDQVKKMTKKYQSCEDVDV